MKKQEKERFSKLDFEIFYITLYLEDEGEFETRLDRKDKAVPEYAKFESQKSINQQREYLKMANEIKEKYPNINVINIKSDRTLEEIQKELREKIGY